MYYISLPSHIVLNFFALPFATVLSCCLLLFRLFLFWSSAFILVTVSIYLSFYFHSFLTLWFLVWLCLMFRPSLSLQFGGCSTPLELGKRAIKTKVAQSKTHAPQRTKTKTLFARLFREGKRKVKGTTWKFFFLAYAFTLGQCPWQMENRLKEAVTSSILRIRSCTYIFLHPRLFFGLSLSLANFLGFCFHGLFIFAYTYQNIGDTHTYCFAFSLSEA